MRLSWKEKQPTFTFVPKNAMITTQKTQRHRQVGCFRINAEEMP